jgi:hypothetical protein
MLDQIIIFKKPLISNHYLSNNLDIFFKKINILYRILNIRLNSHILNTPLYILNIDNKKTIIFINFYFKFFTKTFVIFYYSPTRGTLTSTCFN